MSILISYFLPLSSSFFLNFCTEEQPDPIDILFHLIKYYLKRKKSCEKPNAFLTQNISLYEVITWTKYPGSNTVYYISICFIFWLFFFLLSLSKKIEASDAS